MEIHTRETDAIYVLDGEATFVIVVPAGVPHWFKQVPATLQYYVVKVTP